MFCGINIGHVLAYAPKSPDGIWPDVAVREIIEEIASIELERAIQTGVYNKCPVVTKLIDQGGVQERQLAQTYRSYAIAVGDTHPIPLGFWGKGEREKGSKPSYFPFALYPLPFNRKVLDTHPRTAAILRCIADSYNSDAYKEDNWAELQDY